MREGHGQGITRRRAAMTTMALSPASASKFGYMFSAAPDQRPADADRLPEGTQTIADLTALGAAMGEGGPAEPNPDVDVALPGDGTIPAGYTYFGQFVDHDITKTEGSAGSVPEIDRPSFPVLTDLSAVANTRTPFLELDSVYGKPGSPDNIVPPPVDNRMVVGEISKVTNGSQFLEVVPLKGKFNDLPRKGRDPGNPGSDREARIGDPRNDENLIVAQMHVAFLKAHNTLAEILGSFDGARTALTKIYQSVVIDDYLHRICDPDVLADIETNGPKFFKPTGPIFMPIEFAAAGFRFGHSMVRTRYDFNLNFKNFDSKFFFVFTALSGQLGPAGDSPPDGFTRYPDNWIIEWERFLPLVTQKRQTLETRPQRARPIDPKLTQILFELKNELGQTLTGNIAPHLARRNLLRGYLFALPTGQAVARRIGTPPIEISASTTGLDQSALQPFTTATPLWLYVLTEAKQNDGRLGVVGTRIVAETLHTLVRRSVPSIFNNDGSRNMTKKYKLSDIIHLAAIHDPEVMEPDAKLD